MKKYSYIIIPLVAVLISCTLVFTTADKKIADLFQRPLKSTNESKSIMMINVDDASVDEIGTWPFSRDVYSTALVTLRELGAKGVIFDLSFTDKSPARIDESYVNEKLPEYIENAFNKMDDGVSVNETKNSILLSVSHVMRNLDEILAGGLKFFNNTTLAMTMTDYNQLADEENKLLEERIALSNIESDNDTITPEFKGLVPAIPVLMEKTGAAGFVNADVDNDGYLRRLHLVGKYNGKYYGQLVFNTFLNHYGNPKVIVSNSCITLKDAVISRDEDGNPVEKTDIKIPRSNDGSIIIKYPKKVYNKYNQTSLWTIYRIASLEESLKDGMRSMYENGLLDYTESNPVDIWEAVDWLKDELYKGEDPENDVTFELYNEYKIALLDSIKEVLSEDYENLLYANIEDDGNSDEIKAFIKESVDAYRIMLERYEKSCDSVRELVDGTYCIIGTTATSTTDWGINQYEDHYPNPGVHYALANQLLARDFVDDSSMLISILAAFILSFGYSLIANKIKGTGRQIVSGVAATILSVILLLGFFIITRIYIGSAVPVMGILLTFIISTVFGFITASKDKKFITNAFSQCLSKEVVNEIVANPSSFKLGGERVEMTAIFTDIQKFSGFSELLSASQLVALLNYYLTKMSDIIMEERGTVDKYEGDAIIALVGAPVKMADHASRAVSASLKMKAAEVIMNQEIKRIAGENMPEDMDKDLYDAFKIMVENDRKIFTRIGLNSGEMIAGYMGSENKKNYTMMGNNVNLASRLEGVNKQYSTAGILMSEATRNLLGDRFVVRRLDRVRVVNVNTPIRLYEPLCEKVNADEVLINYVSEWEKAVDLFEQKDYAKSYECFLKLAESKPEDKTARYYLNLLENFFCKGKYPVESDNVGVEYIPEDNVFKLLQK